MQSLLHHFWTKTIPDHRQLANETVNCAVHHQFAICYATSSSIANYYKAVSVHRVTITLEDRRMLFEMGSTQDCQTWFINSYLMSNCYGI